MDPQWVAAGTPTANPPWISPHACAPCSATKPEATRQEDEQQHQQQANTSPAAVWSPMSSTSRMSTPRPLPVFDTALYDAASDSIHIMPHSISNQPSRSTLDAQFQDFKNRIDNVKSHRAKLLREGTQARPHSLTLPLRASEAAQDTLSRQPARASSVKLGYLNGRAFDLMAPPPGRRSSTRSRLSSSASTVATESVDANPSEALASQIASSILRERYGVRAGEAAPLKVQDAVRRCLQDVSTTVQEERPQWGLQEYSKTRSRASTNRSGSSTRSAALSSRQQSQQPSGEEDDPFLYDTGAQDHDNTAAPQSASRSPSLRKKARTQDLGRVYPCPFRRRNPVTFNIRDHEQCARRHFADISELKFHVRTYHREHKPPFQCPRCKKGFVNEHDVGDHLTVSIEEMCEPRVASPNRSTGDAITDEMDRILAGSVRKRPVQSWEALWQLLFPNDATVLDPEFIPVVEVFEAEQEFDDSSADLKADLCESLQRLLPDHAGDELFFQVIAGQVQLVCEQHRAKVNRRCRNNASIGKKAVTVDGNRSRSNVSRFSVNAASFASQTSSQRGSVLAAAPRKLSQSYPPGFIAKARTATTTPSVTSSTSTATSIYSDLSGSEAAPSSRASGHPVPGRLHTRSSTLSSSTGMMPVESPRLPFRDWVQGVKVGEVVGSPLAMAAQRDSGLAMQCEGCYSEPCQCEASYADQLSAFMTPAPGMMGPIGGTVSPVGEEEEEGEAEWYGDSLSSAGLAQGRRFGHPEGQQVAVRA